MISQHTEINKGIQACWIGRGNALYASTGNVINKSTDQGITWTQLKEFDCEGIDCVYTAKKRILFISPGIGAKAKECGIWRSTNEGISWKRTLPLPQFCSIWNIAEDRTGVLFTGVYTRSKQKKAQIYNSKDNGESWQQVYSDPKARHIHQVSVDADTGYVYASVGDKFVNESNIAYLIRSTDHGDSWNKILPQLPQILSLEAIHGAKLFGTDDICNGQLYRTTDDINLEKVLDIQGHGYCFWIRQNNLTGRLFASFVAGEANKKAAGIYESKDGGLTWNLWRAFESSTAYEGSTRATNFADGRLYFSLYLGGSRKKGIKVCDTSKCTYEEMLSPVISSKIEVQATKR